jgi:hypothetical protein
VKRPVCPARPAARGTQAHFTSVLDRADFGDDLAPGLGPPRPAQHAGAFKGAPRTDGCSRHVSAASAHPTGWHGGFPTGRPWGFAVRRCFRIRAPLVWNVRWVANPGSTTRLTARHAPIGGPFELDERERPSFPLRRSRALCLGSSALRLRHFPTAHLTHVSTPLKCLTVTGRLGRPGPDASPDRGALLPRGNGGTAHRHALFSSRAATLTRIASSGVFTRPESRVASTDAFAPARRKLPFPRSLAAGSRRARC